MAFYLKKHKKKRIRIARTRDLALLLLFAEQQGYFADAGLDIEYVETPYGRLAMEWMIEGKADMGIYAEFVFAYLGFYNPKLPMKAIASVERRSPDNIIMRWENGVPSDLIGKKIGFAPRTTSHSFLLLFLKEHGIDKRQVKLKGLSPQAIPDAFIRGDIDAMSLWQPYAYNTLLSMKELGLPYTHFKNSGLYQSDVVLAATKSLLATNGHAVKKILECLQQAEQFCRDNPQAFQKALLSKMRITDKAIGVFEDFTPMLSPISPAYLENINRLADLIIETDTQFKDASKPDYMDYVDNTFLLDIIKKPV